MTKPTIKIDVVSDVVCPWCYIGKRRLDKALEELNQSFEFQVRYHPFQLNPEVPAQGVDQKEHLINKFGGPDRYEKITQNVSNVAAGEGLNFDFEKQKIIPNTLDAHRIILFAASEGKQREIVEAFFKAYFEDGKDLSKSDNLINIAMDAGINGNNLQKFLADGKGIEDIKEIETNNRNMGISGVPFYIINDKYAISGAQPTDVFIKALTQVGEEVNLEGQSCDIDGNNC